MIVISNDTPSYNLQYIACNLVEYILYIFVFTCYFSSDERAALERKNQELQRRIEGLQQERMSQRLVSLL